MPERTMYRLVARKAERVRLRNLPRHDLTNLEHVHDIELTDTFAPCSGPRLKASIVSSVSARLRPWGYRIVQIVGESIAAASN
jgi:hypothetical protein